MSEAEKAPRPWVGLVAGVAATIVGFALGMALLSVVALNRADRRLAKLELQAERLERDFRAARAAGERPQVLYSEIAATSGQLSALREQLPPPADPETAAAALLERLEPQPGKAICTGMGEVRDRDFYLEQRFRLELHRVTRDELITTVESIQGGVPLCTVILGRWSYLDDQPADATLEVACFYSRPTVGPETG